MHQVAMKQEFSPQIEPNYQATPFALQFKDN